MRKISEIIKVALPHHAAASPQSFAGSGLCFVLTDLCKIGLITLEERREVKYFLQRNVLKGHAYLSYKLKVQKKASSLAARVAYYQRLVTKLEKKGL